MIVITVNLVIFVNILFITLNYELVQALHHPFTAPNPEDINDLASARALAYDMVYNGVEVIDIYL
jgi:aspartyl-tRNA synthetase